MNYSVGETRYLCKYAARGAGLSWGMADEAADAVVWLQRYELPGASMLLELLRLNDLQPVRHFAPVSLNRDWQAASGRLCPVATGAALSDCAAGLGSGDGIRMLGITHPVLLLPFVASAALVVGTRLVLEWEGLVVIVGDGFLEVCGGLGCLTVSCMSEVRCARYVRRGDIEGSVRYSPDKLRVALDEQCRDGLLVLAQRTYAPATEDSRKLGAGAGLNDND